jgi:hypothetical protein
MRATRQSRWGVAVAGLRSGVAVGPRSTASFCHRSCSRSESSCREANRFSLDVGLGRHPCPELREQIEAFHRSSLADQAPSWLGNK